MKTYIGTKIVRATSMTRQEYNELRGWTVPSDENPDDAGYLIEYQDGGKPNTSSYAGYVSWSPKKQFDSAYLEIDPTVGQAIDDVITGEAYHWFPGTTTIVCALHLRNGYVALGRSDCASPEEFNQEISRKIARNKAREEVRKLESYRLRDTPRHAQSSIASSKITEV